MADLSALIQSILEEGEQQARTHLEQATRQAREILEAARRQVTQEEAEALRELEVWEERERIRLMNRAWRERLALRLQMEARLLDTLYRRVQEALPGLRHHPRYPQALRVWWAGIVEAARSSGQGRLPAPGEVHLHPEDLPLLEGEIARTPWRVVPHPRMAGGVRVVLEGGTLWFSQALEDRLARWWEEGLPDVRKWLFEGEGEDHGGGPGGPATPSAG